MLFVVFLSFVLSGCGNKMTEGKVYEKEFIPAYTEEILVPMMIPCGKTYITTFRNQTNNYPDKWYIKIQSVEADEDGKHEKATYSVSEEIFNQYEVGDFYSHEK